MSKSSLIGRTFGYLRVDGLEYKNGNKRFFRCTCLYNGCKNSVVKCESSLYAKRKDLNCGCLTQIKRVELANRIRPQSEDCIINLPNGKRINNTFKAMKQRCYNPNDKRYKNYGGRGITVCDEWLNDKRKFYEWAINNGYRDDLTIDRIDVNGNYEPSNCRWATIKEQETNRSNNIKITYKGETHALSEWSEIVGEPYRKMLWRYHAGKSVEEVLCIGE